jgi:hypothetical protein
MRFCNVVQMVDGSKEMHYALLQYGPETPDVHDTICYGGLH